MYMCVYVSYAPIDQIIQLTWSSACLQDVEWMVQYLIEGLKDGSIDSKRIDRSVER